MVKIRFGRIIFIICVFAISSAFLACGPTSSAVKVINLNRDRYECKLDPSKFDQYHGKQFLLSSIEDKSNNTDNLYYYNPQKTIGYRLYYSDGSLRQPVVSYYWYALQKAFDCAGMKVEEYSYYDTELALTFNSLTDEEIQFDLNLMRKGRSAYAAAYTVKMPKVDESRVDLLEQRAYASLDSIVTTILDDQNFEKAFLKKYVPPVQGDKSYENIRGLVLKNGKSIKGGILNKGELLQTDVNTVQMRNERGEVVSYSFDEVMFFF